MSAKGIGVETGDIALDLDLSTKSGLRDLQNETTFGASGIVNAPAAQGVEISTPALLGIAALLAFAFAWRK